LFKEMLNNVVKHAGCSNCTIRLELQKGLLTLIVSDDGVGFNPGKTNSNRNGMESMYNRAQKLNGTVKVISADKQGSTLQVQLKA
jgi:signal transduction histidine kinase